MCDGNLGPMKQAPLHQFWWLHDARWYQGVLKRFGQEAANEINAEAVKFVARRVAAWYAQEHKVHFRELPVEDLAEQLEGIFATMGTAEMSEYSQQVLGPDEWETVVTRSFSLKMLRIARTLEGYECPCMDLRAGWFEGMGISVSDRRVDCQRTGGTACRFRAVLRRDGEAPGTHRSPRPPDHPLEQTQGES